MEDDSNSSNPKPAATQNEAMDALRLELLHLRQALNNVHERPSRTELEQKIDSLRGDLEQLERLNRELRNEIEQRKKTEEELRYCEERFGRLRDSGVIGFAAFDLNGNVFRANDTFMRIISYTHEDLMAGTVNWSELTPPELQGRAATALQQLQDRGVCDPYEHEFVRKDGSRVQVLFGGALLHSKNEGFAFVLEIPSRSPNEANCS